jgi:hypothetical protein
MDGLWMEMATISPASGAPDTSNLLPPHTHTSTPKSNPYTTGQARVSLLNVLGELKKCCNHPFLFESAEDNYRGDEHDK